MPSLVICLEGFFQRAMPPRTGAAWLTAARTIHQDFRHAHSHRQCDRLRPRSTTGC